MTSSEVEVDEMIGEGLVNYAEMSFYAELKRLIEDTRFPLIIVTSWSEFLMTGMLKLLESVTTLTDGIRSNDFAKFSSTVMSTGECW